MTTLERGFVKALGPPALALAPKFLTREVAKKMLESNQSRTKSCNPPTQAGPCTLHRLTMRPRPHRLQPVCDIVASVIRTVRVFPASLASSHLPLVSRSVRMLRSANTTSWDPLLSLTSTTSWGYSPLHLTAGLSCACVFSITMSIASCDDKSELAQAVEALHIEHLDASPETLQRYQKIFHECAGEGERLTKAHIEALVAKETRDWSWSKTVHTIANVLFPILDMHDSGGITFAEFAAGLTLIRAAREGTSPDCLHEFAWRALDVHHHGYIGRGEVLAWVKLMQGIDPKSINPKFGESKAYTTGGGFNKLRSPEEITWHFMKLLE